MLNAGDLPPKKLIHARDCHGKFGCNGTQMLKLGTVKVLWCV